MEGVFLIFVFASKRAFGLGAVAHACNPNAGRMGWCVPVIPLAQEAEARESLESGRQRLQ